MGADSEPLFKPQNVRYKAFFLFYISILFIDKVLRFGHIKKISNILLYKKEILSSLCKLQIYILANICPLVLKVLMFTKGNKAFYLANIFLVVFPLINSMYLFDFKIDTSLIY